MARAKKTEEELEPTPALETDVPLPGVSGLGAVEGLDEEPDLADEDDDEDDDDLLDVPATTEGKASAARLIDLLVEKKALALHVAKPSAALIEAVAKALEWPGPIPKRANKLSDAIVDSDDVDELFVDDETLGEILKRW